MNQITRPEMRASFFDINKPRSCLQLARKQHKYQLDAGRRDGFLRSLTHEALHAARAIAQRALRAVQAQEGAAAAADGSDKKRPKQKSTFLTRSLAMEPPPAEKPLLEPFLTSTFLGGIYLLTERACRNGGGCNK